MSSVIPLRVRLLEGIGWAMPMFWSATAPSQQWSLWMAGLLLGLTFFVGISVGWLNHPSAVPGGPVASTQGVKVDVLDLALAARALWLLGRERSQWAGMILPLRALWLSLCGVGMWRVIESVTVFLPLN